MSYLDNPYKDPNDPNQNQVAVAPNAPQGGRGASSNTGLPSGQQGSGRFTDLKKYMAANAGAGQAIGQKAEKSVDRGFTSFQKGYGEQNKKVSDAFNQGRQILDTEGAGFQNQLGQFKTGIDQFQGYRDADTADQTAFEAANQGIQSFAKAPTFKQFQNIQAGTAIDENSLLQNQAQTELMNQQMLNKVQGYNKGINTEAGRTALLNQSRPRFGNYDLGNQRLDQLFLQTNAPAIQNIQNKFGTQAATLSGNQAALATQGQNVNKLATDESALAQNLTKESGSLQDLFEKRLGTQQNIQFADKIRRDAYNDYVNQMGTQGGTISADLAKILGIGGIGGQGYQAAAGGQTVGPQANQFTAYNTNKGNYTDAQGNASNPYLQYTQTRNFQDLLGDNSFNTYDALGKMSGLGTKYGPSTIGSGTTSMGNYSSDLSKANQDFMNQYTTGGKGKAYSEVGFDGLGNVGRDVATNRLEPNFGGLSEGNNYQPSIDYFKSIASQSPVTNLFSGASTDVDRMINEIGPSFQRSIYGEGARYTDPTYAMSQGGFATADANAQDQLNKKKQEVLNTGVKDVRTLGTGTLSEQDKYKRFAGLL